MLSSTLLSDDLQHALHAAEALAREHGHASYSAAHLLRALVQADAPGTAWLLRLGYDVAYLREWAEVRMEELPGSSFPPDTVVPDAAATRVLAEANNTRLRLEQEQVQPAHVLAALARPHVGFSPEQLRSLPLREVPDHLLKTPTGTTAAVGSSGQPGAAAASTAGAAPAGAGSPAALSTEGVLHKYCRDLTALARAGHFDPLIGRERELRLIMEILGRRSKPNLILTGDPGVGKTALLAGLAQQLVQGPVPPWLQGALLLELDPSALVAGASYKGEVEDRLKSVLREIKQFERCLLFIDEIQVLLDPKGSAGSGAGNLLKPELARGELILLGATTREEYRKLIEPDQALSRRFELLDVPEPTAAVAERMLRGLLPAYEQHHQLTVAPDVVPECVRLAKRYVKDRRLPDAALDLLDRTMAAIRTVVELAGPDLAAFRETLEAAAAADCPPAERLAELQWLAQQLQHQTSPVLMGQWTGEPLPEPATADALLAYLRAQLDFLEPLARQQPTHVGRTDLAAVVAYKTGIPLGKVQEREKEKLLAIEDHLRRRVVGQDHALKVLSDAILESRSGLQKAGQPIGTFFLLGPTGTGKTELSKSLAEFLFNDEQALIRFDMSEFKEEHAAALLYGAPPGYVGYEEGGLLVNRIRQQPYAVVLFDEIEKAHPSVFDVFLQIMDEGRLHDKLGKQGDFSNALLIFTSNIGSEWVAEQLSRGRVPDAGQLMARMSGSFRPEFLARITEIVPFGPISPAHVERIFDIQLRHLADSLHRQGVQLDVSPEARQQLALSGYSPQYGARPLAGVIRSQLRRPISRMLIAGELAARHRLAVDWSAAGELTWRVEPAPAA